MLDHWEHCNSCNGHGCPSCKGRGGYIRPRTVRELSDDLSTFVARIKGEGTQEELGELREALQAALGQLEELPTQEPQEEEPEIVHCICGYVGPLTNEGYDDLYPWCPDCKMT